MESAIRHIPASFDQIAKKLGGQEIKRHKIVSLFSGCGGMDLGFMGGFEFLGRIYDVMPFEVIWANDISPPACDTYRHNLKHDIICGDISTLDIAAIPKADIVLGGFPCQDFSVAGKRRGFQAERGQLYRFMADVIEHCQPRVFVAENVKGLLSIPHAIETITDDFGKLGYQVEWKLLNAADYGVPQNRERVVIVGIKAKSCVDRFAWPYKEAKQITAQQALKDIEPLDWEQMDGHTWARCKKNKGQGNKPINADTPSTTIRAEHHGNIEFHYSLPRRLSVREAARLQSFPDSFSIISNQSAAYRQVGNAVPPVMAWNIAKSVLGILQ